jgi:hypothetical protein
MFKNCVQAVKEYKPSNQGNVDMDKKKVVCSHEPSTCIIVGNTEPVYACCEMAPKSPQRVYHGMRFKDLKEITK